MPSIRNTFGFLFAILGTAWTVQAQHRPAFHHTPPDNWMNDPQRPFYAGGEWHMYYLYNADFDAEGRTGAGGTAWYHATSIDMMHWTNEGIAIDKYKPAAGGSILGDVETGSAILDNTGSTGFGQGAVVALLTQMQDGI